jgi:peptidoglycan/xylan/chitin deacetylase (PgdA/CDA1 family)
MSAMAWAVRGRSSSVFGPSFWRAASGRKAIALTFDDGPSPSTPQILDILERYSVRATFFQIGSKVLSLPEIARAVVTAGHETGNHSHTHPNFALARPDFIQVEFQRAQEAIYEHTGQIPRFMRAPFGVRWFGFRAMQQTLGLTGAMWSIIGLDWKLPADAIAHRVLSRVADGDIICLHDGRGTLKDSDIKPTIEAVRRIVPDLLDRGYHFETVSQLICPTK